VSSASKIKGVSKVLFANNEVLGHSVGENIAKTVLPIAKNYTHVLTAASNVGKSFMPRLGALMDAAPLSDVIGVVNDSTFKRPMYAGNAISTVQMSDATKV
jgi:electron transfer flavoprotein alpha subunit